MVRETFCFPMVNFSLQLLSAVGKSNKVFVIPDSSVVGPFLVLGMKVTQ